MYLTKVKPFLSVLSHSIADRYVFAMIVIIDEMISKHNEVGRTFWKTKIAKVDQVGGSRKMENCLSVPWNIFIKKFASFCSLCKDVKEIKHKVKIRALRLLLGKSDKEAIPSIIQLSLNRFQ